MSNALRASGWRSRPPAARRSRRGAIQTLQVTPSTGPGTVRLRCNRDASPPQLAARRAWLGSGQEDDGATADGDATDS